MKRIFVSAAAILMVASTQTTGFAQGRPQGPQPRRGHAESSLIGVSLFDTGQKLIAKFGSPVQIIPLSVSIVSNTGGGGGGAAAGDGGAQGGPPPGFNGRGGLPPTGPGGAGGGKNGDAFGPGDPTGFIGDPFNEGTEYQTKGPRRAGGAGGAGIPGGDGGGGAPAPSGGGGGGGGAAAGPSGTSNYTRWIYNRDSSRYAFVLDQYNRVVQIEVMGITNRKVRTKRGITFGSSFGQIINRYNSPDTYEIGGNNIILRYLNNDRVAFRLAKLDPKKPHVVTGIVVAAGRD